MNEAQRRAMNFAFHAIVPLNNKLGLKIDLLDCGIAHTTLPPNPSLADEQGHLHNGALTTILDTTAGMAAFMSLDELMPFATLNMRMDFHQTASIDQPIGVVATLHTKGPQIIAVHATAQQKDIEVASAPLNISASSDMSISAKSALTDNAASTVRLPT